MQDGNVLKPSIMAGDLALVDILAATKRQSGPSGRRICLGIVALQKGKAKTP